MPLLVYWGAPSRLLGLARLFFCKRSTMKLYGTDNRACLMWPVDRQLVHLMFRWNSPMRRTLRQFKKGETKARLVWGVDEGGKVLAWGLLTWGPVSQPYSAPEIMLYTRGSARGQGLGKYIFWALRHTLGEPKDGEKIYAYYPHDKPSTAFYQRMFEARIKGEVLHPEVTWLSP